MMRHCMIWWASGLTQKYKALQDGMNIEREKYHSIARYKDDALMNMELEKEHRAEDPLNKMEGYKATNVDMMNDRPFYKGKAWPNRYGILPGYRWDGVDRSNAFEGTSYCINRREKIYKKRKSNRTSVGRSSETAKAHRG
eukprot:TRINITY_DN8332_c0_g1_i1.p1 TRINITY_DN8332_c0_g1~~TRINITY_DN8332_c0_g1_i1.p1  ORF type:complete len:140 (-),score=38.11 TRINITY_DN8332_c0_g1_i1:3-422(-)